MQLRKTPILLSMMATMALLFGGWFVYQKYDVEQPIRAEAERMTAAKVEQLTIDKERVLVQLSVTDPVQFPKQYQRLYNAIEQLVPDRHVDIEIVHRDTALQNVWDSGLFAITEAVETHRYGQIPILLNDWRKTYSLDAATSRMDDEHIYIYLKRGKDDFFVVVPRGPQPAESGVTDRG